jgi:hypothetical protein
MEEQDRDILANDLLEVAERLRASRPQLSPIELDEMKRRVMTRATRSSASARGKGQFVRSKIVTVALTLALVASTGTAGVLAGGKGDGGSAAKGEYCDGKDGHKDGKDKGHKGDKGGKGHKPPKPCSNKSAKSNKAPSHTSN